MANFDICYRKLHYRGNLLWVYLFVRHDMKKLNTLRTDRTTPRKKAGGREKAKKTSENKDSVELKQEEWKRGGRRTFTTGT